MKTSSVPACCTVQCIAMHPNAFRTSLESSVFRLFFFDHDDDDDESGVVAVVVDAVVDDVGVVWQWMAMVEKPAPVVDGGLTSLPSPLLQPSATRRRSGPTIA